MRRAIALLLTAGLHALAQAPPPAELRALLVPLRAHAKEHEDTRGATPVLTQVKRVLRDWVESRLPSLAPWDEGAALSHQLNTELQEAGVACGGEAECPDQALLGFLGDITIRRSGEFLVVQTSVDIQCGSDESAYAYEPAGHRWHRFWESEQNNYTKSGYLPQYLRAVLISPTTYKRDADKSEHLVLTLGVQPAWCESNWYPVYYRVWQTKSAYSQPKLLLDGSEYAFVAGLVKGSISPKDVHIEYTVSSIEAGFPRLQVRHYVLAGDRLDRVDPVAFSPRDFVGGWLRGSWAEASRWTEAQARPVLEKWHQRLKGPSEMSDSRHCTKQTHLWQVGIEDSRSGQPRPAYFLIRWQPPYHFTMVEIAAQPWPDCTEKDQEADRFLRACPDQDWCAD